jgi:hypothetical protein
LVSHFSDKHLYLWGMLCRRSSLDTTVVPSHHDIQIHQICNHAGLAPLLWTPDCSQKLNLCLTNVWLSMLWLMIDKKSIPNARGIRMNWLTSISVNLIIVTLHMWGMPRTSMTDYTGSDAGWPTQVLTL